MTYETRRIKELMVCLIPNAERNAMQYMGTPQARTYVSHLEELRLELQERWRSQAHFPEESLREVRQ